jgi:hypothetical protein
VTARPSLSGRSPTRSNAVTVVVHVAAVLGALAGAGRRRQGPRSDHLLVGFLERRVE